VKGAIVIREGDNVSIYTHMYIYTGRGVGRRGILLPLPLRSKGINTSSHISLDPLGGLKNTGRGGWVI